MVDDRFIIGLLILPFAMILLVLLLPIGAGEQPPFTGTYKQILRYYTDIPHLIEIKEKAISLVKNPFLLKGVVRTSPAQKPSSHRKEKIEKRPSWNVSLVIMGRKGRYAIINNLFVKEGDMIKGYLVKKIGLEYVILTKDGQREVVYISK